MTDLALLGLLVGLALLAVVLLAILNWDDQAPPAPDTFDDDDDQIAWDVKAKAAADDFGLKSIREVAGKWAASAAAILGILSSVAFIAGPDDLVKDVGGDAALLAAVLILIAAAVAAVATLLAALAEQGTPVEDDMSGGLYRASLRQRASRSSTQIKWSRLLTVGALCLVIAATGISWLKALAPAKKKAPAQQSALVVSDDGTQCGTLISTGDTVSLKVGKDDPKPIPTGATVTLVDACPTA